MSEKPHSEKLHKVLARSLPALSRRQAELWIRNGRVTVNGQLAKLGDRVGTRDQVTVDGRALVLQPQQFPLQVLRYHKPAGLICTRSDPQGRVTIYDRLPKPSHGSWVSVGRLDVNTSGLLLLVNRGDVAHELMHPKAGYARQYRVRVFGEVTDEMIAQLRRGRQVDGQLMKFDEIERERGQGLNRWYRVTVHQGRYRMVRRLWEAVGCQVNRLIRIRFGGVVLPGWLAVGDHDFLTPKQLARSMRRPSDHWS